MWEINPGTGAQLRSWDFSALDYGGSALIGIDDSDPTGNAAYVFTSDYETFAYKISRVTLADKGTWSGAQRTLSSASLGTSQGMCCRNGNVYYLCDNPAGGQRVLRYSVSSTSLVEDRRWHSGLPGESEGLAFDHGGLAIGMRGASRGIYHFPMNSASDAAFDQATVHSGNTSERWTTAKQVNDVHGRYPAMVIHGDAKVVAE